MATTSIDTSALVKRYVAEVGSAWIRRMVARPVQHVIYTAALTEAASLNAMAGGPGHSDVQDGKPGHNILSAGAELNRLYPVCIISMSNQAM